MSYNPWLYVFSNPIRNADPSGLYFCESYESCLPNRYHTYDTEELLNVLASDLGAEFLGTWESILDLRAAVHAIYSVAARFGRESGMSPEQAFQSVFQTGWRRLILLWGNTHPAFWGIPGAPNCNISAGGCTVGHTRTKDDCGGIPVSLIKFVSFPISVGDPGQDLLRRRNTVVHELGHLFGATVDGGAPYQAMSTAVARDEYLKRDDPTTGSYYGFAGQFGYFTWQQSYTNAQSYREIFADQFLGWVFDKWFDIDQPQYFQDRERADARRKWMNENMPGWVGG